MRYCVGVIILHVALLLLNTWGERWYTGTWRIVLSGWLWVCVQYAVAVPFHLLSNEKLLAGGIVIKSIYWCHVCSFPLASVSYSLLTMSGEFSISVDWMDSICSTLLCQIKENGADWLDSNIVLRLGDFTLQAMLCLLKQQLHNGKDASPWSALWFIFALMWVLLERSYLATCEKKFQPSLLSPWRKSSTQSHHYKWQLQQ